MGCILGQHDETGKKEQVIYYLGKRMTDCETRYPEIEKVCLTLVWAVQRLRHYMLCYTVYLLASILSATSSRRSNWPIVHMADDPYPIRHLIRHSESHQRPDPSRSSCRAPVARLPAFEHRFPRRGHHVPFISADPDTDRWTMYFDGAVNKNGRGAGAIFISPRGDPVPAATQLGFQCTHNMAEYEACILGLRMAIERGVKVLDVYGLVIYQIKGFTEKSKDRAV